MGLSVEFISSSIFILTTQIYACGANLENHSSIRHGLNTQNLTAWFENNLYIIYEVKQCWSLATQYYFNKMPISYLSFMTNTSMKSLPAVASVPFIKPHSKILGQIQDSESQLTHWTADRLL